ncbi:MAG: non-ribosomal peptide synthase/polyketide synthase [Candidatus Omnitrophota bacterium]
MSIKELSTFDSLWIAAGKKNKEKKYWMEKLCGEPVKSAFPFTYMLSGAESLGSVNFRWEDPLYSGLMKLSAGSDIRLHIILCAIMTLLLSKHTGNEDIIIGTLVSHGAHGGRGEKDVDDVVVENLINTILALRNQLNDDMTFKELLLRVRQTVIEADENRNYPFEVLIQQLDIAFSENECPLFDVAIILENIQDKRFLDRVNPKVVFSFYRRDGHIDGKIEYHNHFYSKQAIKRIIGHLQRVTEILLFHPEVKVSDIEIITDEEKHQLLNEFNGTTTHYSNDKTIHGLFEDQVNRGGDRIALVGVGNSVGADLRVCPGGAHMGAPLQSEMCVGAGPRICPQLSYNQLNEQSDQLAQELIRKGVGPDVIVGIKIERSVELIIGILSILKAGGAYLPIDSGLPQERIDYMLNDSQARLLITHFVGADPRVCPGAHMGAPLQSEMRVGADPRVCPAGAHMGAPLHLAYIIYTSGSTGKPKGVMIRHSNMCPLLHWGYEHLGLNTDDRTVQNLSYYFDWSVWEIFITLTSGASLYMVSTDLIMDSRRYREYMNRHRITVLHITPTHFQTLIGSEGQFPTLRHLCIGAEKLTHDLVKRSWERLNETCRIYNMYGPTETTIVCSVLEIKKEDQERYLSLINMPIGSPSGNTRLWIVDKHFNCCPIHIVGELVVSGEGVAPGYLNNPELTAEKFSSVSSVCSVRKKVYKTGDLCRWSEDGDIEFLGRIDHQVKIRGYRIELGEIENRLLNFSEVKDALIVVRKLKNGEHYLCGYVVLNVPVSSNTLKQYLSKDLPAYMIPTHWVILEKMPLNPNGKVDTKALPDPEKGAGGVYTAPGNDVERKLAHIWSDVLGLVSSPSIDDPFLDLGGHSLQAAGLVQRIYKDFEVEISVGDVFVYPTIRKMAQYILNLEKRRFRAVEFVEEKEYYPISSAQRRLFILHLMAQGEAGNTGYNMPWAMELVGALNAEKLEMVFNRLIERHESLRTSFHIVNDEPVQRIHDHVGFEINYLATEYTEVTEKSELNKEPKPEVFGPLFPKRGLHPRGGSPEVILKSIIKSFITAFDLAKAPLLRVGLIEIEDGHYILIVDMHHIISDGTSMGILMDEFMTLYRGGELSELRVRYRDYVAWQSEKAQVEIIEEQEKYWCRRFEGEIPVLDLPLDSARPQVQTFEGDRLTFEIGKTETAALKALAVQANATLYMTMLALYYVFLFKLSGQDDIIVGTPVWGRNHSDVRGIIGMFVNTLALRHFPSGEKTFRQFLKEVRYGVLDALSRQDYPYENLVDKVGVARDTGRNPLFDVFFMLQNMDLPDLKIPGLKVNPYPLPWQISKFDLLLSGEEGEDNVLLFSFEYSTRLFRKETVLRFIGYYKRIIQAITETSDIELDAIDILSEEEKYRIGVEFNQTEVHFPKAQTLHEWFDDQALRTPDHIALIGTTSVGADPRVCPHLSYNEMSQRSDQLANRLIENGVGPDVIVGIKVERSVEMVIGILGILKAGGAYLPIDPDLPQERIDYMLTDSQARLLVTHSVGADLRVCPGAHMGAPLRLNCTSNLAYMIYTSGSTGRPKGVMIEHRNIVNLLQSQVSGDIGDIGNINFRGSVLQFASIGFDVATQEIFSTLLSGGRLAVVSKETKTDIPGLFEFIRRERIGVLFLPPAFLKLLFSGSYHIEDFPSCIRHIIAAGEQLVINGLMKDFLVNRGVILHNHYGPSETHVVTTCRVSPEDGIEGRVPIGTPISNTQIFILDRRENLVPVGVIGELYIGGANVGRGYLNNPEMTSERFCLRRPTFLKKGRTKNFWFEKLYKTGDLGQWRGDGNIEFLGRVDRQVKIRGFRIELEEIERRLLAHDKIKDVAVTVNERSGSDNGPGDAYLCAHVVLSDCAKDESIDTLKLKEYLSRWLPDYMMPSYYIKIDRIPVNKSGKVDREPLQYQTESLHIYSNEMADAADEPGTETEKIIAEAWKDVLKLSHIGVEQNFFDLGGNSLNIIQVNDKINTRLGIQLPVTTMFRFPTVGALARFLTEGEQEKNETKPKQAEVLERVTNATYTGLEIAVVGMAGRFPGAGTVSAFWNNLKNGVESITFFTDRELEESGVDPEVLKNPNYIKAYGIMDGVEYFDSNFFGYRPKEAEVTNPQLRIFLECAWTALEDAGYCTDHYAEPIGLFAGSVSDFNWKVRVYLSGKVDELGAFAVSNLTDRDFFTMWISYKLNLKGPAVLVQTACSTSLVAIHMACNSLIKGECSMAMAGGVAIAAFEKFGYIYQEGMILSPDGHCRAFDANSGGTVGGDGVGIVVLKPLAKAEADGDHIYAVIKGTAINNDGVRKVGFTAPSIEGQAEVIRTAQSIAGVEAESIRYVETHGTGTELGDPVEIEALKLAFHAGKEKRKYCAIGSVKTNVGHLDVAAGVTGFIKTVLSLYHRQIPPSLHFENPNPKIDFMNSPFYVNTQLTEWKADRYPRRAGVSSFGIGGTNAHVVLEEYQGALFTKTAPWTPAKIFDKGMIFDKGISDCCLMIFSAKSSAALDRMLVNFKHFLGESRDIDSIDWRDAAYTLQVGRAVFPHRAFFVCNHTQEALNILSSSPSKKIKRFNYTRKSKAPVFIFSGQGTYYIHMGAELYRSENASLSVFQREMDRCFDLLKSMTGEDFKSVLYPEPGNDDLGLLNRVSVSQPLLFVFEYALARMLIEWGIRPGAAIGYSTGEYVSACLAGVFTLEDAIKLVVLRGRLMEEMPAGAMLGVPLSERELMPLLESEPDISLAVDNGVSCIVSGLQDAVNRFEQKMKERKLLCMRLALNHAAHSHVMEPVLEKFESMVRGVKRQKPNMRYISTVTGTWVTEKEATDPAFWANHLRRTVRFAKGIQELLNADYSLFIEIGPGKVLSNFVRQNIGNKEDVLAVNLIRDNSETVSDFYHLMDRIGRLWLYGLAIDWKRFYGEEKRNRLSLPGYAFERIKYSLGMNPLKLLSDIRSGKGTAQWGIEASAQPSSTFKADRPGLITAYMEPETETERVLVQIWENFFGIQPIGVIDDFFELGGDSLKAMNMLTLVHQAFDIKISLEDFFKRPAIRELGEWIDHMAAGEREQGSRENDRFDKNDKYETIEPAEEKEYYVLSPSQKRTYILHRMDGGKTAYNETLLSTGLKGLDRDKLEAAFRQLIQRHESLRTSFVMVDGQPVQRVHETVEFRIEYDQEPEPKCFDLSQAPLLRVVMIETGEDEHVLFIEIHHIITDGTSQKLLHADYRAYYEGRPPVPLRLQYKDYAEWLNRKDITDVLEVQGRFWRNRFDGEIPVLTLPLDFPRPLAQSFKGQTIKFCLDKDETRLLKRMASQQGVTLYMVLLAVIDVLLAKLSGSEDIVVGTPAAGRRHADLLPIVGMFVNTLAMRNFPGEGRGFDDFLHEVKARTLEAFENQEYPFEELVEHVDVRRDLGRNPLFDVMVALMNQAEVPQEMFDGDNEAVSAFRSSVHMTSKFDMAFYSVEAGERIHFMLEYCIELFKESTIRRFIGYLKNIVHVVGENPAIRIGAIDILSEGEKEDILRLSTGVTVDSVQFETSKTLHEWFDDQVNRTPDHIALIGETSVGADPRVCPQLSYNHMSKQSDQLASELIQKGVGPDVIVGIKMERSVEMVIGILGILKAGGAYLPIADDYPQERIDYMLRDSQAYFLVTHSVGADLRVCPGAHMGAPLRFNCTSNLAYVIYTSGSTGKPKGVMIEHRNIVNLMQSQFAGDINFSEAVLQFASIGFDVATQEIFSTLLSGGRLAVVSKETKTDIPGLLEFIRRERIGVLFLPPAFLKILFSGSYNIEDFPLCIRHIIAAGEQLVVNGLMNDYLSARGVFLHNHYGPSETHVVTTTRVSSDAVIEARVSIGKPISNTQILIMDRSMKLVPCGVIGELYIGGANVGRGYLNNPEMTSERFCLRRPTFLKKGRTKNFWFEKLEKLYKTGDLGKWRSDGNIEFLGRADHQVKIRGFRIELGEIEDRLFKHPHIKEAVVVVKEEDRGDKYLVAYIVSDIELSESELREYLLCHLPDYMVLSYFIRLEAMPLTSSGKINRNMLPDPELKIKDGFAPPRNAIEEALVGIWSDVLGIDKKNIGIYDNFFQLGGHSLKAVQVTASVHKVFDVELSLIEIFKNPFIGDISNVIASVKRTAFHGLEPVEEKDYYVVSSAQKRLYILQQMMGESTGYNMPTVMVLDGELDREKFEHAFHGLVKRHESLRTSFHMIDDRPVQRIHEDVAFEINYLATEVTEKKEPNKEPKTKVFGPTFFQKGGPPEAYIKSFIHSFDLSRAPLMRVGLMRMEESRHLMIVDMHHIVSDGVSISVLVNDFMALYGGREFMRLRVQYKDYSEWLMSEEQARTMREQEAYWLNSFEGEIPVLELPVDYPRPSVQSFEGSNIYFEITPEVVEGLKRIASETQATLYMILLSVYNVLLSKLTQQEDMVVGSPIAGRRHADLEAIVGIFINTLALRNYPSGEKTFTEFVHEVKERTLGAFENQAYQYEDLVEHVVTSRDTGRNPLFDVALVLQNFQSQELAIPGLKLSTYEYEVSTAKFDLMLTGVEEEGKLHFTFEYRSRLFKRNTIERFIGYFKKIIDDVIENRERRISDFEIITEEGKRHIVYDFNRTATQYPKDKTIHELFEEQVGRTPDHLAVIGLTFVGALREAPLKESDWAVHEPPLQISYRELNERANHLASELIQKGVITDTIVAIKIKRSIEMVIGILGILKAGGAYLPIGVDYPQERIDYILKDSQARLLVTHSVGADPRVCPHAIEELGAHMGAPLQLSNNSSLAYIIYTSGSTGNPKGVLVDHPNVVRLVKQTNFIDFQSQDRILQTGALEFDASTFEIWGSLLNGLCLYLMDKDDVLNPERLKRSIREQRITIMWMTSPLFNQMVQSDEEIFGPLRCLLVGGDVLSPTHINRVKKRFPDLKIINGYGPTENTTFSTTFLIDKAYEEKIPIGKPIANSTAYIVDKAGHIQPVGIAGELWVGGDGVSRGYLNNPELSFEKFLNPFNLSHTKSFWSHLFSKRWAAGGNLYKTGDLAQWLDNGNIDFSGRIDQQVKIRGFRIELEEIENRLLEHHSVRDAVVIVKEDKGKNKYLCAYVVSEDKLDIGQLRYYLSNYLPNYMIPSYVVQLEKIPLTVNGKVDWRALPEPTIGFSVSGTFEAPRDRVEKKLAQIWSDVLGIEREFIGRHSDFFELGGHSLKATLLVSKIHQTFDVNITLAQVFFSSGLGELAALIDNAERKKYISIDPVEKKEYYALSSAQKRLYVLQQMDPQGTNYNIPSFFVLEGELDLHRLEDAFEQLIDRHESLRTSFHLVDDQPVQRVRERVECEINYLATEVTEDTEGEKKKVRSEEIEKVREIDRFVNCFDLRKAPLMRVGWMRMEDHKYLLSVDMHHIVSDGTSMNVIMQDFMVFYRGGSLPRLRVQYKDYSEWQKRELSGESLNQKRNFWLNEFGGEIPVLELPVDFPRPSVQSFDGRTVSFELDKNASSDLKSLVLETGATMYMVLLALTNVFLAKLSNQEDMVVGSPVAGRRHVDLENIVGMFINTLALRNYPEGEKTFIEFLYEVKTNALRAFDNQEYQYEALVEQVVTNRDTGRNPLFDVMFVLQNFQLKEIEIPGLTLSPYEYENKTSKFDLTLTGIESDDKLLFTFEYCTQLFKPQTIERFIAYFKNIINGIIENKNRMISDIEIITEGEKNRILYDFNRAEIKYPNDKTIHELFEEQVERTPDHLALIGSTFVGADPCVCPQLSYDELNSQSDRLAYELIHKGVHSDTIVAIKIERSIEMIIGIIGILKAGGAYLPIDPGLPQERIDYMLKDSRACFLVTRSVGADPRVCPHVIEELGAHMGAPLHLNKNLNLAYIIYTSGSTGKPKGVLIRHSNICPLLHWGYDHLGLNPDDRSVQNLSYYFDWSVWEIFITLTSGASLHMVSAELTMDGSRYADFMNRSGITVLHITPTHFQTLIHSGKRLSTLRHLCIGAEKLTRDLVERACDLIDPRCCLYNMYGPTEATILAAVLKIDKFNQESYDRLSGIPIGKNIANNTLLILDKRGHLTPPHVFDELVIGGDGVSPGYLNNPELTAEKFSSVPSVCSVRKKLYKTGDLCRWLEDGTIEFLGRIDHQVKIRGFRIELGEIEDRLLKHEAIKEAVVIVKEDKAGEKYLAAYVVSDIETSENPLRDYLLSRLPHYMVPSVFVRLEKIPLNANGKLDRKALPEPELTDARGYAAPGTEIEKALANLWSEVLSQSSDKIGIDDNFFALGGHSLKATILTARLHHALDVEIPLSQIFKTPTIREMAHFISTSKKQHFIDLTLTEDKEFYEPSFNQKRLWLIHQIQRSSAFHMPGRIRLDHEVKDEWIENSLVQLFDRHDSFRTGFRSIDGQPVQFILKELKAIPLKKIDLSLMAEKEKQSKITDIYNQTVEEPFDFTQPPLFRSVLLKLNRNTYELMFNMHHIITDGWSMEIIKNDFNIIYEAYRAGEEIKPEPLTFRYRDFSEWHHHQLNDPSKASGSYRFWKQKLKDGVSEFKLPGDFSGNRENNEGAGYSVFIDQEISRQIKVLAQGQHTTLFTVMFSIYLMLLSRFSGEKHVVSSIIGSGRPHVSLHPIVGFFVNSIIYHTHVDAKEPFAEFLKRMNQDILDVFEHQDYPLEPIFEEMKMRYPEISISFNMLHIRESAALEEYKNTEPVHVPDWQETKFDLEPYLTEYKNGIHMSWSYKKHVFKPQTIEYMVEEYQKLLDFFSRNPQSCIMDYRKFNTWIQPLMHVCFAGAHMGAPLQREIHVGADPRVCPAEPIQNVFTHQVKQNPDRIAVKIGSHHFSYAELDRYSGRIAGLIQCSIEGSDQRIGLYFEHGVDMVASIIGVLKSGNIYVPLSVSYPKKRLSYMLENSESSLLLTNTKNQETALELANENRIHLGNVTSIHEDSHYQNIDISAQTPAYILYTSGSTGNPKGLIQNHNNVLYYTRNWARLFSITPDDKMTLFSSFCHDGSVQDMFGALLNGATLYLYDVKNREESAPNLSYFLTKENITIWHSVPSLFNYFVSNMEEETIGKIDFSHIRFILLGGEPLREHEVAMASRYFPHSILANIYGQTESSVSSIWKIDPGNSNLDKIIIGQPLDETGILLLDEENNLVGPYETGEIVIASSHLALGYWKNDEATENAFFNHPVYGRLYRTGDLGRLLSDGNIEFIGRRDTQVKIRGFRIELGEIESQLLKYPGIKEAVVRATKDGQGELHLCAYTVSEDKSNHQISKSELREHLSAVLPDYMVPTYFMRVEKMPLNPTGKIDRTDRNALPEPEFNLEDGYTAPRNTSERMLAKIWSDILAHPVDQIGIDHNFFELGGHSFKAAMMMAKIRNELDVNVPLAEILRTPTIRELASLISTDEETAGIEPEPIEEREYYELSFNQKRLWVIHQLQPDSISFNMPGRIVLAHAVDEGMIQKTIEKLMQRHESLRTAFKLVNGEGVQFVESQVRITVNTIDLSLLKDEQKQQERERVFTTEQKTPFDLSRPPLFRCILLKVNDACYDFIFNMHHIISDGWSIQLIQKEFALYYDGFRTHNAYHPAPLTIQYKDVAARHNSSFLDSPSMRSSYRFWKEKLTTWNLTFELPVDALGDRNDLSGSSYRCILDEGTRDELNALARENRSSLFTVLFSVYLMLLSRIANRHNVLCSIIASGRGSASLQHIMGFFVNSLLFGIDIDPEKPFIDFFREVSRSVGEVFQHQDYPLEPIFKELKIKYPEVPVSFNFLNIQEDTTHIRIDDAESGPQDNARDVKFDIEVYVTEYQNGLLLDWVYKRSLFSPSTVEYIVKRYIELLRYFKDNPQKTYKSYEEDKQKSKKETFKRRK